MTLISSSAMLAPFRVRSFRFQWPADLLTSWGIEMENLVLGWYTLVETGSVLALTLFWALQYLGTLLAPVFGMAGDRIGHRTVLCAMRAAYALVAAAVTGLAFAGMLEPAYVFATAALSGLIRPSDQGMRNALVGETMPAGALMATMGVSRTTADSARIAGALAGAGLFALFGMGPVYLAITGFYALSFLLTLGVAGRRRRIDAEIIARPSLWRDLAEGLAYVWDTPCSLAAMWLAFLVNDRVSADQRSAALCCEGSLRPGSDRARDARRQHRLGLAARLGGREPCGAGHPPSPHDDPLCARLVSGAAPFRPDAGPGRRPPRAHSRRLYAEPQPRADVGHAADQRRRTLSRAGHGRAHAGDLWRADRADDRRRFDRAHRLCLGRLALLRYRSRADDINRTLLAGRSMAARRAGKLALRDRCRQEL